MVHREEPIDAIPSRKPTDEEQFYIEYAYKEPVDSITRIEDVAKFLLGATVTASGLMAAAVKISQGTKPLSDGIWWAPFVCWAASIVAFIFVLFPQPYPTGENEPATWKAALNKARWRKYGILTVGAMFFVCGLFAAILAVALTKTS